MEALAWGLTGSLLGGGMGLSMYYISHSTGKSGDRVGTGQVQLVNSKLTHIHKDDVLYDLFSKITELQLVDKTAFHDLTKSIDELEGLLNHVETTKNNLSPRAIIKANRLAAVARHVLKFYKNNLKGRPKAVFDDNESKLNQIINDRLENVVQTVTLNMR